MDNLMHIGATKEAMKEVRAGIIDILKQHQEQETLRKALDVLGHATDVTNVSIMNCNFTAGVKS